MAMTNRAMFALGTCVGAAGMMVASAIVPRVWAQEKPKIAPLNVSAPLSPESQARMTAQLQPAERTPTLMQTEEEYVAVLRGNNLYIFGTKGTVSDQTRTIPQ